MPKREVKRTVITYQQQQPKQEEPERSREKKQPKVEVVDQNSRKARLAALKKRQEEQQPQTEVQPTAEVQIKIEPKIQAKQAEEINGVEKPEPTVPNVQPNKKQPKIQNSRIDEQDPQEQEDSGEQKQRVIMKPVFISKEDREMQENVGSDLKEEERKKKALRYTTKMLLIQNAKAEAVEDEEIVNSSDEDIRTDLPDDDDQKNEEFEYEQWKIRELKRIRRDRQERRRAAVEKAQIERRRKMNNQQILLQNKVMGSDATDNTTQTKYVFMQKYYHKGAFYQDSDDAIFKRDYNLPTPLQMQDKSMLPEILQRRKGNFGAKGQSKYKHLSAEDTTSFDPQYRPDESILASWKKKTGGYKGSGGSNI